MKANRMKTIGYWALGFALGMLCLGRLYADSGKRVPVVMQLDWIYNAQFAGLYQALERSR